MSQRRPAIHAGGSRNPNVRSLCFTSYDEEPPVYDPETMQYMIYQREECPTTKRKHYQGYIIGRGNSRKLFSYKTGSLAGAHVEVARGSHEQCIEYCSKPETRIEEPVTFGEVPKRGGASHKRSQGEALLELVKAQKKPKEILEEEPDLWFRHYQAIPKATMMMADARTEQTPCEVVLGKTGTGKTYYVRTESGGQYYSKNDTDFWDGYDGTEAVLLDDFYGNIKQHEMLRLINHTDEIVNIKHGSVRFKPAKIWITSNDCPSTWYKNISTNRMEALYRRFSTITVFTAFMEYRTFRSGDNGKSAWENYWNSAERLKF